MTDVHLRRNLALFTAIQAFNVSLMDFYFQPFHWKNAFLLDDVLYRHLIHESYHQNTSFRNTTLPEESGRKLRAAESTVDSPEQAPAKPMMNHETQTSDVPNFMELESFDGDALFRMTSNATLRLISIFELEEIFRAKFRQLLLLNEESVLESENERMIIQFVLSSIDRFKKSVFSFYQEPLDENKVSKFVLNDMLRSYLNITAPTAFKTIHDLHTFYLRQVAADAPTHPPGNRPPTALNTFFSEIVEKNLGIYYKPLTFADKSAVPNVLHPYLEFQEDYTHLLQQQQDKSNFIEIFNGPYA